MAWTATVSSNNSRTSTFKRHKRICYTFAMFLHLNTLTGCNDRGAWPWRRQPCPAVLVLS